LRIAEANHLRIQLFGYLPGKDSPLELVNAFALGTLLALDRKNG